MEGSNFRWQSRTKHFGDVLQLPIRSSDSIFFTQENIRLSYSVNDISASSLHHLHKPNQQDVWSKVEKIVAGGF